MTDYPKRPQVRFGVVDSSYRPFTEDYSSVGGMPYQIGYYVERDPDGGLYDNLEQTKSAKQRAERQWKRDVKREFARKYCDPLRMVVGKTIHAFSKYSDALYFYVVELDQMMEIMFPSCSFSMSPGGDYETRYKIIEYIADEQTWVTECGIRFVLRNIEGCHLYGAEHWVDQDEALKAKFKELIDGFD